MGSGHFSVIITAMYAMLVVAAISMSIAAGYEYMKRRETFLVFIFVWFLATGCIALYSLYAVTIGK